MRHAKYDMNVFQERRSQLADRMRGGALIIPSNPEYTRNNDVGHAYRQDSNFFYLTGFEEPESIFVFRPGQTPETVMFVRPKDVFRETWDGFRFGPEATQKEFKIDKTYLISEFDSKIDELLKPVDKIFYRFEVDAAFDRRMIELLSSSRSARGRTGRGNLPIHDAWELIGELRVIKSLHDVQLMRKACEISSQAHIEAMKFARPGVTERQVQGVLLGSFYMQNADREGYNSIVATGANATTLHYVYNDQTCQDGDLLLIDAGAEKDFYTGDITRTYPVNGKFTAPQKKVYERVLEIEKALIAMVKPGIEFVSLQDRTVEYLTDAMIDLKLLSGSRQSLIDSLAYKKYYPHGVSHYLGMDVHDAGLYVVDGKARKIEPGFSFTIEPGIYIPYNDEGAPAELRGIGIRIEDNVVVTPTGCENMTESCPKEIKDMEAIIGTGAGTSARR